MASSLLNAIGRLVASSLSDIIGRKKTLIGLFILSFLCCVFLVFARGILLVILFAVLSFAYGGFFATFPAVTTDSFGIKHSGSNYGLVMLGLALASLMAMLISAIIQAMGLGLTARFIASVIIGAIGIVLVFFIKKPKQD
jgi:OFA family oxalate/formate antiporter-like MFS transporter